MSSPELPSLGTWRRYIWENTPAVWRAYFGSRSMGTLALLWDAFSASTVDALRAPFLELENGPAYDALRPIGQEQSMPQYPIEDWLTYRNRLREPWATWEIAGTERGVIEQLAAAGVPNGQIFRNGLSSFRVFYAAGDHSVTGQPLVGGFTVGDGTFIGPIGISPETIRAIPGLINHWKPANWVCTDVVFELSGWTIGTGHTVGEVGLVIGGEHAVLTV